MSLFETFHVPVLWTSLIAEFGRVVNYSGGDGLDVTLTVMWKEGASDEDLSPGRYSHIWVQNGDIPGGPLRGALIESGGMMYDITRVDATAYGYSSCVIQERPGD